MTSFNGIGSLAKMTSLGGKLTALACHLTKRINKAEELTYLSTNIGKYKKVICTEHTSLVSVPWMHILVLLIAYGEELVKNLKILGFLSILKDKR
jgi:hypothetical protein